MKKLLILGGSHSEIPIIKAAKEMYFYVITLGNNPEGLGHKFSDEYINADFSEFDEVLDVVKKMKIDFIVPGCNDFSMLTAAHVSEEMKLNRLDSLDTNQLLHHKDKFREFALKNKLRVPFSEGFENKDQVMENLASRKYPLIIKPIDLSGGKGIAVVNNNFEVEIALEKAFSLSKSKKIVVEDYIDGSNHGYSVIIKDQRILFEFWDNEYYFMNKFMVSGASSFGDIKLEHLEVLRNEIEYISTSKNLVDGLVHVQFILAADGPYIIEICRRPPGDLYVELVEMATGNPYAHLILKGYLNELQESDICTIEKKNILRHCVMATRNGNIKEIYYSKEIKNKLIKYIDIKQTNTIENYLTEKKGIAFFEFENETFSREICNEIDKHINLVMEESNAKA